MNAIYTTSLLDASRCVSNLFVGKRKSTKIDRVALQNNIRKFYNTTLWAINGILDELGPNKETLFLLGSDLQNAHKRNLISDAFCLVHLEYSRLLTGTLLYVLSEDKVGKDTIESLSSIHDSLQHLWRSMRDVSIKHSEELDTVYQSALNLISNTRINSLVKYNCSAQDNAKTLGFMYKLLLNGNREHHESRKQIFMHALPDVMEILHSTIVLLSYTIQYLKQTSN